MEGYSVRRRRKRRGRFILRRLTRAGSLGLKKLNYLFASMHIAARITIATLAVALIVAAVLLLRNPKQENIHANVLAPIELLDPGEDPESMTLTYTPEASPDPTPEPTPTPDPTLSKGLEGEDVANLQARLMKLGYLDIDEPTEYFGPATKSAVERFQRQHDLQQDGIAGIETLAAIYSDDAKSYTLMQETSGTDVENFQRQLKDLGYLSKVTGYYGDETVAAVKAFQKRNGLKEDGKAGEKTFNMINSDKAKASPELEKQARSKASISKMIETARAQLGKKYILGNVGPNSYDCSGLVYYCLRQAGSNRRRLNAAGYSQVSDWTKITSYSKLQKGDLLFFYNDAKTKIGHVGIYIGGGEMIDASSGNGKVVRRSCTTSYWKSHFVCARRPW